jgi:hypothetical protein
MIDHAVEFYKTLSGREDRDNIKMLRTFGRRMRKLQKMRMTCLKHHSLKRGSREQSMAHMLRGLLDPMTFPSFFYQKFWDIIKTDFMALVRGFEKGELNIVRLNYAMIILIPEKSSGQFLDLIMMSH